MSLFPNERDHARLEGFRDATAIIEQKDREIERLRTMLREVRAARATNDWRDLMGRIDAELNESTKDTAQDPGFYDPRLPRFYAESRCSQCGHPEEHIKRTGCPEKCGREPLVVKERAQTDAWPRRPDGRCAFCGAPPGEPHKFRCTPSLARAALEKGDESCGHAPHLWIDSTRCRCGKPTSEIVTEKGNG